MREHICSDKPIHIPYRIDAPERVLRGIVFREKREARQTVFILYHNLSKKIKAAIAKRVSANCTFLRQFVKDTQEGLCMAKKRLHFQKFCAIIIVATFCPLKNRKNRK